MITYNDIYIWSVDQKYIDDLEYELSIDAGEAVLYSLENWWGWIIANDIISFIQTEWVSRLDVSDESKDLLDDWQYTNCCASGFSINIEDFEEEDREKVEDFVSNF